MDVIIPTTGKRFFQLRECINSLKQQTIKVNIILVLASNTNFIEYNKINEMCVKLNCLFLREPFSKLKGSKRAVACNFGLKHSESEFVAFVDDDVSVPPQWAESSLKYFQDPNVAGVTSGCTPYTSSYHLVQTIGSDAHAQHFNKQTIVESIPGYNSVYRRESLILVGSFNERIGGCEDWELNYRLRKKGFQLLGIPETPVEHRHTYTLPSFVKQMYGYGWSRSRLFKQCHIFTPQHAAPTAILFMFLIFPFLNNGLFTAFSIVSVTALIVMSFLLKPNSPKSLIKIFFTFIIMHLSWALGYLKGLIL